MMAAAPFTFGSTAAAEMMVTVPRLTALTNPDVSTVAIAVSHDPRRDEGHDANEEASTRDR